MVTKDESDSRLKAFITVVFIIALLVLLLTLTSGCANIRNTTTIIETRPDGTLIRTETTIVDESFDPKWSNKESIIKTGNIGLSL